MTETSTAEKPATAVRIPMTDVVRFVRQLSHDLRNHLNAAELQSAYMNEIANDAELKGEVQRLRGMLSEMATALQRLSASLAQVRLTRMPYEARLFAEDLQEKIAGLFPQESGAVRWQANAGSAQLEIDPQVLQQAFIELFANAFQHSRASDPIVVSAETEEGDFIWKLHEPKTQVEGSTENWGREPFKKVSHGHYGLGLHRARAIIEAHDGRLDVRYDPVSSSLITTVAFPVLSRA